MLLAGVEEATALAEDWPPVVEDVVVTAELVAVLLDATVGELGVDGLGKPLDPLVEMVTDTPVIDGSTPDWVGSATAASAVDPGASPMTEAVRNRTAVARKAAPQRAKPVA